MIKEMSSELFDLEFENEHGFRILKYHNPEEYLENERFLSFFDTGHVSGWVAMHIRPDEYSKLIDSNFSPDVLYPILFKNESSRFFITTPEEEHRG